MTVLLDDLIAETTVTTGTGTISLDGAQTGYSRFRDLHPDGGRVGYRIFTPGGDFESGLGRLIYGATDTITRDIVLVSSNGGTGLVNFAAGTKQATGSFETAVASQVAALGICRVHRDGTNQSISSSTLTKVEHDTVEIDTEGWFDETTNYRYQPTLPGIYLCNAVVRGLSVADAAGIVSSVLKNGVLALTRQRTSYTSSTESMAVTGYVDLNGHSDYVEHHAQINGTGGETIAGLAAATYFEVRRVG